MKPGRNLAQAEVSQILTKEAGGSSHPVPHHLTPYFLSSPHLGWVSRGLGQIASICIVLTASLEGATGRCSVSDSIEIYIEIYIYTHTYMLATELGMAPVGGDLGWLEPKGN